MVAPNPVTVESPVRVRSLSPRWMIRYETLGVKGTYEHGTRILFQSAAGDSIKKTLEEELISAGYRTILHVRNGFDVIFPEIVGNGTDANQELRDTVQKTVLKIVKQ